MGALALVLDIFILEETYQKTLLQKRAAWIRTETQNFAIHHVTEEETVDFNDLVKKHLVLPLKLLFLEPIVLLITIYTAFIYGILYLFLEAYPIVFAEKRGINEAVATLPYIGLIIGVLIGCGIVIAFEPRYNRKLRENNNIPVPEQRLLPMMVGAVLFPIGLFWFAWTGNYGSIHWIVPTLSGLLTGAGIMTIFLQALNYLIDAYLVVAASAIAANSFLRSFFGAGFRKSSSPSPSPPSSQLLLTQSSTLRNTNVPQPRRRMGWFTPRLPSRSVHAHPVLILYFRREVEEEE
jgi:DHA1 family multidrug resistance protein-like MFS transporter